MIIVILVTVECGECRLNRHNLRGARDVYNDCRMMCVCCTTHFGVEMYVLSDPVVALATLVYHRLSK